MLRELHVKNYALLENLTIEFGDGLNLLTGETGVGKSILIGALGFLLGEKGDVDMIRTNVDRVTVEGIFEISKDLHSYVRKIANIEIEPDEKSLILRRNFNRNGRGQCYLNDSPVSISLTREIGDLLLDIHGQHDHQSLLKAENHLYYLDSYARTEKEREDVRDLFRKLERLTKEITEKEKRRREIKEKEELWRFQLEEIERARIDEKEDENLERERNILENAELLLTSTREISERLSSGEGCIGEHLGKIKKLLEEIVNVDSRISESFKTAETLSYQVDDLWRTLLDYQNNIEFDPVRLNQVNERLDLINTMKKKYGSSLKDILSNKRRIELDLQNIDRSEEETKSLEERSMVIEKEFASKTMALSSKREKEAKVLESRILKELASLGMENSQFQVEMQRVEDPEGMIVKNGKRFLALEEGMDRVEFLLSTNPGEDPKPLRKIASGGEISRIMLALKGFLKDRIPTLIFDEVDVGIGGKMAEVIGHKLGILAKKKQIICITHLPQIAVQGELHYQVIKKTKNSRTITLIDKLEGEKRKHEIARMLGGIQVSPITLQHAEDMLKKAGK
jgi:DNA repair protein RecN (Recombination protein N)